MDKIKLFFFHFFVVMMAPMHLKVIEKWCPHKGNPRCRIWTCPAHYDADDLYSDCRFYRKE